MSRCLILAGGRAVRLKPLSDKMPKPMARVNGHPILEHTLSILPEDISEVFVVIGWLGHQIKDYFGDSFGNKKIFYLEQPEPKGTFHALTLGKEFLKNEPFLVVSGDDLYSKKDIEEMNKYESAILAHKAEFPEKFGICRVGNDGHLLEIKEKPKEFVGDLANIGVYKLPPTIFDEEIVFGTNGEQILAPMIGNLAKKEKIKVVQATFWHPIADMNDLEKAQGLV